MLPLLAMPLSLEAPTSLFNNAEAPGAAARYNFPAAAAQHTRTKQEIMSRNSVSLKVCKTCSAASAVSIEVSLTGLHEKLSDVVTDCSLAGESWIFIGVVWRMGDILVGVIFVGVNCNLEGVT